jgi:hypothetical protein
VCKPQLQCSRDVLVLQHPSEQLAVQPITTNRDHTIKLLQLLQAELANY